MDEMGVWWGPATTLHLLTDFGLACKPDRHLLRTVEHLNLIEKEYSQSKNPCKKEVAIYVNERIYQFITDLYGSFSPNKLRYVDKILMEISLNKLI